MACHIIVSALKALISPRPEQVINKTIIAASTRHPSLASQTPPSHTCPLQIRELAISLVRRRHWCTRHQHQSLSGHVTVPAPGFSPLWRVDTSCAGHQSWAAPAGLAPISTYICSSPMSWGMIAYSEEPCPPYSPVLFMGLDISHPTSKWLPCLCLDTRCGRRASPALYSRLLPEGTASAERGTCTLFSVQCSWTALRPDQLWTRQARAGSRLAAAGAADRC